VNTSAGSIILILSGFEKMNESKRNRLARKANSPLIKVENPPLAGGQGVVSSVKPGG
jgi:hypothetical protein